MENLLRAEMAVQSRYSAAAKQPETALCCPVQYEPEHLEVIPPEVIEKDYGCGNPARRLHPGQTVLDLGSGAGKICIQILERDQRPWRTVEGIEFRSVTVQAFKGKQGPCCEHNATTETGPCRDGGNGSCC